MADPLSAGTNGTAFIFSLNKLTIQRIPALSGPRHSITALCRDTRRPAPGQVSLDHLQRHFFSLCVSEQISGTVTLKIFTKCVVLLGPAGSPPDTHREASGGQD